MSGESLLRYGKKQGYVELNFKLGENNIIIKRTLKRGKNGIAQGPGYIIINDKKYDGTPTELKARILELIGYPPELLTKTKTLIYRYTVYVPQERMKQIIMDDAELRLEPS